MREPRSRIKPSLKGFSAALLLLWLSAAGASPAGTVAITAPSDTCKGVVTLGPKRDFLVHGTLSGFESPVNVKVSVTDSGGTVVRTVTSAVNAQGWSDNVDVSKVSEQRAENDRWTNNREGLKKNRRPTSFKTRTQRTWRWSTASGNIQL